MKTPRLLLRSGPPVFVRRITVAAPRISPDSKDPYYSQSPMRPQATNLSDTDMRDLAAYFAAQTPTASNVAEAPAAMAGKGEALSLAGDPARGIPPCQGCHGADARGSSIATGQ